MPQRMSHPSLKAPVVGQFSKIDGFVSRYESQPTDAFFAPVVLNPVPFHGNPDESGPVPLVPAWTIYRRFYRGRPQYVSQKMSHPSLKAPAGRHVYSLSLQRSDMSIEPRWLQFSRSSFESRFIGAERNVYNRVYLTQGSKSTSGALFFQCSIRR